MTLAHIIIYIFILAAPWTLRGWGPLASSLNGRENTMRGEEREFPPLPLRKWNAAIAPGGCYFNRISRLYHDARALEGRFATTTPTCSCHKTEGNQTVPHTHSSRFIERMSEHIDQATSDGTLTIVAPTGSVVIMHATWGNVTDGQWTTYERIQDKDGTEAAAGDDIMSTDLDGRPVFTRVRITAVMPLTFSKAADTRRKQVPESVASTDPNW